MKTILLLEDDDERVTAFRKAVADLGGEFEVKLWHDALEMCAECEAYFTTAALISLDHDLKPRPGTKTDPGTGFDAAQFLGDFSPACPVLIHSSNIDCAYSMQNELRIAGWTVDYLQPIGMDWIQTSWSSRIRKLLAGHPNTWRVDLPSDHESRVARMILSLDGLGLGDALGEMLRYQAPSAAVRLAANTLPCGPWFHTDDTEMAISLVKVLRSHGHIHQDELAKRFARRFERDPDRGYGTMTVIQMREIAEGREWRDTAANAFSGEGSKGNGSAMRVAPLGAYFADDLNRCVTEARASSTVTHTHPEGVAGAIAIAVGAAMAWQLKNSLNADAAARLFEQVLKHTPESEVRRGLVQAQGIPPNCPPSDAARLLGNGSLVTAPDTVPFCVWMAAHNLGSFVQALGHTISVGGDCDTNAAIVGGIVALSAGREQIPANWLKQREPLPWIR